LSINFEDIIFYLIMELPE